MSVKRNTSGLKPFKKGTDARRNIKGAPNKLPELRDIFQQALTETDLIDLVAKAKRMGKAGNIKAIEWLYDRIYGKAKQELGFTDKQGNDVKLISFILDDRYNTDKDNSGIST